MDERTVESNFKDKIIKDEVPDPTIKPTEQRPVFKVTCIYCQNDFAAYREIHEHHRTHKECDICSIKFSNFYLFKYHYNKYHLEIPITEFDDKTFSCKFCSKIFKMEKNVAAHIRMVHHKEPGYYNETPNRQDEFPFECEPCNKKFRSEDGLTRHEQNHGRPFGCNLCPKRFRLRRFQSKHKMSHDDKIECKLCGMPAKNCRENATKIKWLIKNHLNNK